MEPGGATLTAWRSLVTRNSSSTKHQQSGKRAKRQCVWRWAYDQTTSTAQ